MSFGEAILFVLKILPQEAINMFEEVGADQ